MGVRKSVFASEAERRNFEALSRRWGNKYRIYHNLPFLSVFDTLFLFDLSKWPIERVEITDLDIARLKKTSIDYTLCSASDEPLLCIEFDGLQEGFNHGTVYINSAPPREFSPWREIIMNLKLKVALGSLFPFFVLSNEHFREISSRTRVAIVDGIIGEVMAGIDFRKRIAGNIVPERMGIPAQDFAALDPASQDECVQNWLIDQEIEADFENNPIYTELAQLCQEMKPYYSSYSHRFVDSPKLAAARTTSERRRIFDEETMIGAECVVHTEWFGDIRRKVWLPRFNSPGFSGFGLTEEIACMLALEKLKVLVSKHLSSAAAPS